MKISSINWNFVLYLALIEGLALFVLKLVHVIEAGFLVGFIPAVIVLWVYKYVLGVLPIKINGKTLRKLPIFTLSVVNGLFIALLFYIQLLLPEFNLGKISSAAFGFVSVLFAALILILIHNRFNFKLKFNLDERVVKLRKISPMVALYVGLFEFFILPLMTALYRINPFVNGFLSGIIGGSIAWLIVNLILEKSPLEVSL